MYFIKQFKSFPIVSSFILNYLFFNQWLINNKNIDISNYESWMLVDPAPWFLYLLFNLIFLALFLLKKIKPVNSLESFIVMFFVFQLTNISNIDPEYFWNTIPDSSTYKKLGDTLFECGKLAINCNSKSNLQWPIGQPIISGILSRYFYDIAQYIYLVFFTTSIYFLGNISKNKVEKYFIFGIIYFVLTPNNYELSSLIISEIPYIFFTSIFLYYLSKNKLKKSSIFAILSILVRPIGVINFIALSVYLLFRKETKQFFYSIIICIFLLTTVMSYNYLFNESFTFSTTISTNIKGDSYKKSEGVDEFLESFKDKESLLFVKNNLFRLYGHGSRDCRFENCFLFNPLFNRDGSVQQSLNENSKFGIISKKITSEVFRITSPLGFWTLIPILYIFVIDKKDLINNLILFIFYLNILLSILTAEYGARWWLLPNVLAIYLLSKLFKDIFEIFTKQFYKNS